MQLPHALMLVAGLGGAATLAAQQPPDSAAPRPMMRQRLHQPPGAGGGREMGMRGVPFAPELLIERRGVLELSPEQVGQLEALAQEAAEVRTAADQARDAHRTRMAELWQADQPDPQAITGEMKAMMAIQQEAQLAAAAAAAKAKALLTPEQRGRVEGWGDARRALMGRRGAPARADRSEGRRDGLPRDDRPGPRPRR